MTPRSILLLALAIGLARATAADATTAPAAPAAAATPVRTRAGVVVPSVATPPVRSDSSVAPAASFEAFRLISDRNIFNPNRTGRRDRSTEEQAPRVDVISLVGTMESDRGLRAFFDGSEPAFRKALRVGEAIDKFKVTKISPNVVDLEREGKGFSVRVGQQFRRPEGADWNLIGEDLARRDAAARAAADNKVDPTAPPVIPANVDEVTRRLMERRAKELKN